MPSTNITKIEDPEKYALASRTSHDIIPSTSDKNTPESAEQSKPKMSKLHHVFLCLTLLLIFTYGVASTAANNAIKAVTLEERLKFQELLDTVEPVALHNVLHEHMKDKYQHGVFEEDKKALEVVHQATPEVAQSLVALAKRQASNATTSTTPESSSVVVQETSTTPVAPVTSTTPPAETATPTPSATQQQTTTAAPEPTTTAVVQPTAESTTPVVVVPTTAPTTEAQAPTTAASTPADTPATSAVNNPASTPATSAANTPVNTPASSAANAPGTTAVANPTTAAGNPTTASTQPSSSSGQPSNAPESTTPGTRAASSSNTRSVTQQIVYTTTLANGTPTTVTSVTVVPANQADQTGTATRTNPNASLQTNAGNSNNGLGLAGFLGAIGVVVAGAF